MNKMKAFVRTDETSQDVKLTEVPLPEIHSDEVLMKVEAFGVGIHDRYFIPQDISFPYVIGSEGAGTITKIGKDVNGFSIGDRMIFTTILQPLGGSWAEYAVAHPSTLIPLPENMTFAQGAALPIAGGTALECMRELQLDKGDQLFIAGASGAIGTLVIQLAVAKGIRVSASASAKNHDYMKSLGAEKTVDYHDPEWTNEIKAWSDGGVATALAIQPGTGVESIKTVKDGGQLITVSGDSSYVQAERQITIKQMGHDPDTKKKLVELVHAIVTGDVRLVIEKEYPFDKALEALGKTETRHARGKLIVNGLHST